MRSYIAFGEGIALPSMPPNFAVMARITGSKSNLGLIIDRHYVVDNASDNLFFETSQQILDTMKQLYQWALGLPEFAGEKNEKTF